ncbi:MAG: PQQ-binding-like beta-propeller repeat protein [Caldisericia bacterium]|nr:PQQ-binding-like beta-propeller repeat protein [Caldisericia bacterium]MDD4614077.1 PQQ-binding-like beta-propeller repeat protein [Caldisericia bacterium]
MIFHEKRQVFVFILVVAFFFASFGLVSCKKENSHTESSPIDSTTDNDRRTSLDDPVEKPADNDFKDKEVTIETTKSTALFPLQGPVLLRNTLRTYPATMGPPGHNSVWNENEIFVSTGDAGFTKIALLQENMVKEQSYLYNRAFLQASEDYFLCRDKTHVFCLSKATSEELWKHEIASYGHDYYFAINTENVTRMLFDSSLQKATITGLHAKTGNVLWSMILQDKSHSFLGFSPYVLLFTKGTSLVGIHPTTGEKIWQHDSVLETSDEPYQQEYYRNFRILSDSSIFVPTKENGEPYAYRIEPETGKILTEYRLNSLQEVRFHNSYFETPSSILCSYRKGSEYFFIAYDKETGSILWETPFHQVLGDFAQQYGVECQYTAFKNSPQKVLIEISYSTVLCVEVKTGTILWFHQSEFSQISSVWQDTFQIRLLESQNQEIHIEFLNLDTGIPQQNWNLPPTFKIPDAPISMIYATEKHVIIRMNIQETPYWLFFQPDSFGIQYAGYLTDSQPNLATSLVFFVNSKSDTLLFLVSGENGYELEVVSIPDLAIELNGDSRQVKKNLRSYKYAKM